MNILVIGGTRFVGRHLVAAALQRNHQLTLFNRGNQPDIFPDITIIQGDRNNPDDLSKLQGKSWDAVIDTCAYFPGQVESLLEILNSSTHHYTLISTISVYKEQALAFQDESAELASLPDTQVETVTAETYGGLKVGCEAVAEDFMSGRLLIVRPGLVVGPFDPTDRFSYWPYRVVKGGEVLAPSGPEKPIQYIDARDLADWTMTSLEQGLTGIYNLVTGPDQFSFGDLLTTCQAVSHSGARVTWVTEAFLAEHQVAAWSDLPLWIAGEAENFLRISNQKALAAGLQIRSLEDTVRDTLVWLQSRGAEPALQVGISPEREQAVLDRWHRNNMDSGSRD
jgi:2'-hydroxyisoflavone reductase